MLGIFKKAMVCSLSANRKEIVVPKKMAQPMFLGNVVHTAMKCKSRGTHSNEGALFASSQPSLLLS
jgi:hypothetical protein